MNAATVKQSIMAAASAITTWCLWWGKLVVAIGIAYAATRLFSLGWLSLEGFRIPIPRVTAEPIQLAYLAGCIWLISR
jgi:hypothetical protein